MVFPSCNNKCPAGGLYIYISPTSGIQSQIRLVLRCSVNGESGEHCLMLRAAIVQGYNGRIYQGKSFFPLYYVQVLISTFYLYDSADW